MKEKRQNSFASFSVIRPENLLQASNQLSKAIAQFDSTIQIISEKQRKNPKA